MGVESIVWRGVAWRAWLVGLAAVVLLVFVAGLLAALGPARRGLPIHPADALKSE